jgi:uncharacterized membrane protein
MQMSLEEMVQHKAFVEGDVHSYDTLPIAMTNDRTRWTRSQQKRETKCVDIVLKICTNMY